ncbi:hypothetical protein ABKV19_027188 [Rosa sericea]
MEARSEADVRTSLKCGRRCSGGVPGGGGGARLAGGRPEASWTVLGSVQGRRRSGLQVLGSNPTCNCRFSGQPSNDVAGDSTDCRRLRPTPGVLPATLATPSRPEPSCSSAVRTLAKVRTSSLERLRKTIRRMRIVGLTGGISSGKSTVSNLFKAHDIPVVDADIVAPDILKKGTGGWKKVVSAFGQGVLQPDGEVDRPKLGQIAFSNPEKRQLLNRYVLSRELPNFIILLAPYISSGIFWEILKLWLKGFKVIVLDVPLLFETKMDRWTKPVIVVWVDPETQLQRLMLRDRTSEDDARNPINAQVSLDLKRTMADIVIDNTGSQEDLKDKFKSVLFEVTKPLSWTELWLSRQGASSALVSVIVGVLMFRKVYNSDSRL